MSRRIGIRREDKNEWERRTPLGPAHVARLIREHGLAVSVQPSSLRVYPDSDYADAGAELNEDLGGCGVVFGVKEIPPDKLLAGMPYVCFAHVIKGQPDNMPTLRRFLALRCSLVDYEPVTDADGQRLIFFGLHAGYAGMIDTLWALGRRWATEGLTTPFSQIRRAYAYSDLKAATNHVREVGEHVGRSGLPPEVGPVVVAFTGSGHVSTGAQHVFDQLPFRQVSAAEIPNLNGKGLEGVLVKTVLGRSERVRRRDGGAFDSEDYAANPGAYESALEALLPHLTAFVNGIYWDPSLPRLITREHVQRLWAGPRAPKLKVIGDITCDVGGSVEVNVAATTPGEPVYVYEPTTGEARNGVEGEGPVIMAVDNLPCELPREASQHFGDSLMNFVPAMAACDWQAPFGELVLPPEIRRAVIAHRGELTPAYGGLEPALVPGGGA